MKTTLETILYSQSPALFLAAIVLLIEYAARRNHHRVKAALALIGAILCVAGGVALYYFGMVAEIFTIQDFWKLRVPGIVGMVVVLLLALRSLILAVKAAHSRRMENKKEKLRQQELASAEAAHAEALEQARAAAYASGRADAKAEETVAATVEKAVSSDEASPETDA